MHGGEILVHIYHSSRSMEGVVTSIRVACSELSVYGDFVNNNRTLPLILMEQRLLN